MYLPSYLTMNCSPINPQKSELIRSDIDEVAQDIAEAHHGLRLLATFYAGSEARARLEAAMRALEAIDSDVEALQEAAREAEKAEG